MFVTPKKTGPMSPVPIFQRLVRDCPEFIHLKEGEPSVEWMFRTDEVVSQGRRVLGTCFQPSVQGKLRPLFDWFMEKEWGYIPDFLVVLDWGYWHDEAEDDEREILIFHETCHMGQKKDGFGCPMFKRDTGEPIWCIDGHDVEEFVKVVARYGAWNPEVQALIAASRRYD